MADEQGWILRNSVIWNKVKGGPDNAKDKLRNVHENVFHFVKSERYFYDADAVRTKPGKARVVNGAIISATGVSGVRYRRQIELSTALTQTEKQTAYRALENMLDEVRVGKIADFRMIIRGSNGQRTRTLNVYPDGLENLRDGGFISSSIIEWSKAQRRMGHFAGGHTEADRCILPPTRKTSARFRSLPLVRKVELCLTRFAEQERLGWWPSKLSRRFVGIDTSAEYSVSHGNGAGSYYNQGCRTLWAAHVRICQVEERSGVAAVPVFSTASASRIARVKLI